MADEYSTKRIINLPAESGPAEGDVFVVDNESTGTKKLPITGLIDRTLSKSGQAADAGSTGDRLENVNGYFWGLKKSFSHTGNEAWDYFPCLLLKDVSYKVTNNNTDHVLPLRLKKQDGTTLTIGSISAGETGYFIAPSNDYVEIGAYMYNGASFEITNEYSNYQAVSEKANICDMVLANEGIQTFGMFGNFQHYGLNTDGTFILSQKYRVSNNNPIAFNRDLKISVTDGFRWGYIPFTGSTPGSWSGWKTSDFEMSAGTSFVVQIAKVSEDTSEVADVKEFVSAVTFNTVTKNQIDENTEALQNVVTIFEYYNYFNPADEYSLRNADDTSSRSGITILANGSISCTAYSNQNGQVVIKSNDANKKLSAGKYTISARVSIDNAITSTNRTIKLRVGFGNSPVDVTMKTSRDGLQNVTTEKTGWVKHTFEVSQEERFAFEIIPTGSMNDATHPVIFDYVMITKTDFLPRYSDAVYTAKDMVARELASGIVGAIYSGEPIPSKCGSFDYTTLFTMTGIEGLTSQDIEIYDDYLFVGFSGTECIKVYSLDDYALLTTLDVSVNHGSHMQFSKDFYDPADEFPLLYVGGWIDNIINVIRITNENDVWSATIIKQLYIPATYGYYFAPSIDTANNVMYCFGNKLQSISATGNKNVIVKCNLNKLTENNDGTFTPEVISSVETNWIGVFQGGKYYNGRLYMGFSETSAPYNNRFVAINPLNGDVMTDINMGNVLTTECEGLGYRIVDNNILWIYTDYTKVCQLQFH
jgi:hypothetical protein